jgi:IclR family mhp operon transcriptional activator
MPNRTRQRAPTKRVSVRRRRIRPGHSAHSARPTGESVSSAAKSPTIRALERGLQVFKALQKVPISTLNELHETTGLPKPSLLRILATLEQEGMTHRRLDGQYCVSAKLTRTGRKADPFDYVAEAAAPVLDRLCQKIIWPSDLAVAAGNHLEIRETSRVISPFETNTGRIGTRINWLLTAHGRSYLAVCPDQERQHIIGLLRKTRNPQDRLAHDPKRLEAILARVRRDGYGARDPTFSGGFYDRPFDDGMSGIAVAIVQGGRAHGTINILWVRRALTVADMVARHLADLRTAAAEIAAALV